MRENCAQYKGRARVALHGKYGIFGAAIIIMLVVYFITTYPFQNSLLTAMQTSSIIIYIVASILITLILFELFMGMLYMSKQLAFGQQIKVRDLFYAFKIRPDRFLVVFILRDIIYFICLIPTLFYLFSPTSFSLVEIIKAVVVNLLLTVAGLILGTLFTVRLAFAEFLLIDNINMTGREAIKESLRLTKGREKQIIYMLASFLGYYILSFASLNVGFLWTIPYTIQTLTFFYLDVTEKLVDSESATVNETQNVIDTDN